MDWYANVSPEDWLLDGYAIRGEELLEAWHDLDWAQAFCDMGPSPAGNPGPYWHVPRKTDPEERVHRLYPKLGNWLPLVRRAIEELSPRETRSEHKTA